MADLERNNKANSTARSIIQTDDNRLLNDTKDSNRGPNTKRKGEKKAGFSFKGSLEKAQNEVDADKQKEEEHDPVTTKSEVSKEVAKGIQNYFKYYKKDDNLLSELNNHAAMDELRKKEKDHFVLRDGEIRQSLKIDFVTETTFCGPMETISVVDNEKNLIKPAPANAANNGKPEENKARFSLVRINHHCKQNLIKGSRNAVTEAQVDFGPEYDHMIEEDKQFEVYTEMLISCLYSPPDNQNLVIVGFQNGHIEIRDTQTLKFILFAHNFQEGCAFNPIKNFQFHMEHYANLNVTYENFANYNIILDWKMKEHICLEHNSYRPHLPWSTYYTSLVNKRSKKCGKRCEPETKMIFSIHGGCTHDKKLREGLGTGKALKYIEQKVMKFPVFIAEKKIGCFLILQIEQKSEKDKGLLFLDIEEACFTSRRKMKSFTIDMKRAIKFICAYGDNIFLGYDKPKPDQAEEENQGLIINKIIVGAEKASNNKKGCLQKWKFKPDKKSSVEDEKISKIFWKMKKEDEKTEGWQLVKQKDDKSLQFTKEDFNCAEEQESVSFAKVEYEGRTCIAVSTVCNLNLYECDTLSVFMDEPYIDSLDRMIKEIHISPCGRILIVCEEFRLSVWDLKHRCRVYKEKCENSQIKHFTNEMLVVCCELSGNPLFLVICFTLNDKIRNFPGRPLKTYPLSMYREEEKQTEIMIHTDPCIHQKIYHCKCKKCLTEEIETEIQALLAKKDKSKEEADQKKNYDKKGKKRLEGLLKKVKADGAACPKNGPQNKDKEGTDHLKCYSSVNYYSPGSNFHYDLTGWQAFYQKEDHRDNKKFNEGALFVRKNHVYEIFQQRVNDNYDGGQSKDSLLGEVDSQDEDDVPLLWMKRTQLNYPYEKCIVPLPTGVHQYYGLQLKNEDEFVLAIEEDLDQNDMAYDRRSQSEENYKESQIKIFEISFDDKGLEKVARHKKGGALGKTIKIKPYDKKKLGTFQCIFLSADCKQVAVHFEAEDDKYMHIIDLETEEQDRQVRLEYDYRAMSPNLSVAISIANKFWQTASFAPRQPIQEKPKEGADENAQVQSAKCFKTTQVIKEAHLGPGVSNEGLCGVTNFLAQHKGGVGDDQHTQRRKIMPKAQHHDSFMRFFSPCSRFVGFETEHTYRIFRVIDSTVVVELQKSQVRVVLTTKCMGGCFIINGLIDIKGRMFYTWSLEALVHLATGSVILFRQDLTKEERIPKGDHTLTEKDDSDSEATVSQWSNKRLLGLPMPALFPNLLGGSFMNYLAKNTDDERIMALKMLTEYTIAPNYQNIFHKLAEDNKIGDLGQILTNETARYLTCQQSPLAMATSQCAAVILNYLTKEDEDTGEAMIHILQRMDYEAVLNITKLPENQGLDFFDKLLIPVTDLDTQGLEINTKSSCQWFYKFFSCCFADKKESVQYAKFEDFDTDTALLREQTKKMSKGSSNEDPEEKDKTKTGCEAFSAHDLFLKSEESGDKGNQTIQVSYTLCKVHLVPGSPQSIEFHQAIQDLEESEIFKSQFIKRILEYKWSLLKYYGWGLLAVYILYLTSIVRFYNVYVLIFWFVLQLTQELYQLLGSANSGDIGKSIGEWAESFWNWMDFLRLILMVINIVYEINDQKSDEHNQAIALLMFFSFFNLLGSLKFVPRLRVLIKMFVQTLQEMSSFIFVVLVMLLSFTITFTFQEGASEVSLLKGWENFKMMYKVMFGNFDSLEKGVGKDGGYIAWALYFVVTIMIPLVMLNLLIAVISETHSKIMEHQEKSDNLSLNEIILDLENLIKLGLFNYFRQPEGNKSYLVIAQYSDDFSSNQWKGRVQATTKKVKNDLDDLYKKLKNENKELKEQVQNIKASNENHEANIKNYLGKKIEESNKQLIDKIQNLINGEGKA